MTKGDHLAYRRAALVSVLGLVFQIVLTLVLFAYGKLSGDDAASASVWMLGSGVLVWALLVLVFDQHRRERLESLESEQISAAGGATSAFEGVGDDMKVAARRLATIQKWVIPAGALVFAGINLSGGFLTLRAWRAHEDYLAEIPVPSGWALALGFGIAVVMFVFARFVSGMGTLKPWANLRAGATAAVAASIVGIVVGGAAFVGMSFGQPWMSIAAPFVVSVLMIVLGSETILNLVLDLYRPRRAGEEPRPAFDSRLLGLVAAPDRIAESVGEALNYQFGIDLTSSWFYQLVMRRLAVLVGLGLLVAWLLTGVVVVGPHQRGLVLRQGKIVDPVFSMGDVGASGDVGPGLHLKLPWPFATFEIPTIETSRGGARTTEQATAGVRVLQLASNPPEDPTKPIVWTESHSSQELVNIVQAGAGPGRVIDAVAGGTAGSLSLLAVEVPVQYVVRDFTLFDEFAGPGQRERVLTAIGRRVVTQYLGELAIDRVLAEGRAEMPRELKRRLEEAYGRLNDGRGAGIELLFVGMNGVHPPVMVAPNFERTVIARQNRESTLEEAQKTKTRLLTEVAGSVDLADQIVDRLNQLDLVRGSGTAEETELEFQVQRLLEDTGGLAGNLLLGAGSSRWERHMSERGRAALLRGQNTAYEASPALFRSKLYFEAVLNAMKQSRVYLTPESLPALHIRLELQDNDLGTSVFDESAGAELNRQ